MSLLPAFRVPSDPDVLARLEALADDDGVVLVFRPREIDLLTIPLQLSDDEVAVEQGLAKQARSSNSLAIIMPSFKWIPSGAFDLFPVGFPANIPDTLLQALGWDDSIVEEVTSCLRSENLADIRYRALGAIGRLLSHPGFCAETLALRTLWRQLPVNTRPLLPLGRIGVHSSDDEPAGQLMSPPIVDFRARFSDFLDRWQLTGMTTWDFPDPLEFHPVDPRHRPNSLPATSAITSISGLIPLNKSDRRFGASLTAQQREFRRGLKLDSLDNKWESYAQLARLRRLQLALQARVRVHPTLSWPIPGLASVLGELMPCDEGHVNRLLRLTQPDRGGE